MEYSTADPNPGYSPMSRPDSHSVLANEKIKSKEEIKRRNYEYDVFYSTRAIGVDFSFATDGAEAATSHIDALHEHGLSTYSSEDILAVFENWQEYQDFVKTQYSDELWDRWRENQQTITELRESGLPPVLMMEFERATSDEHQAKLDAKTAKIKNDIAIFGDKQASPSELLKRYRRHQLSSKLLQNTDLKVDRENRLVSLAIGVNIETGKLHQSSFVGELTKSSSILTTEEIETVALDMGIYDEIYPELRANYLKDVREKSGYKATAKEESSLPEYYYEINDNKLVVGNLAVSSYLEAGGQFYDLYELGDLLRNGLPTNIEKTRMRTMDLAREDFVAIGKWINRIVKPPEDPRQRQLNEAVFMNAKNLGIGFSINRGTRFYKEFSSMGAYYAELGEPRTHRAFNQGIDLNRAISALSDLGQRLGRRPTYKEMIAAHLENPDIPNPSTINRLLPEDNKPGIARLLDEAGWPEIKFEWDTEECLAWGLAHMENTGQEPTEFSVDIASKNGTCAGRRRFRENFGSFSEFKKQVSEAYYQIYPEALAA